MSGSGFAPRVKSTLMGTTARQKLMKFKLTAAACKIENMNKEQRDEVTSQIADLVQHEDKSGKEFDHMGTVKVGLKKEDKKSEK